MGRSTYFVVGVTLMAFKYLVDALVIGVVAGIAWTPVDYLLPTIGLFRDKLWEIPVEVWGGLGLWTLPFIWIGVSMTLRRALDAGRSPWLVLLFFVPVVNYGIMLYLSILPSQALSERGEDLRVATHMLTAALIGAAVAGALIATSLFVWETYGFLVFLVAPFATGIVSAYFFNRRVSVTERSVGSVALVALLMLWGGLLLFAVEGLICILYSMPLGIFLALLGGLFGREVASRASPLGGAVLLLLVAGAAQVYDLTRPEVEVLMVRTAIEVKAPIEEVWSTVVDFPDVESQPAWYFRMGIAYPIRARLEGSGMGAVRYCEFSTGAFVEPITAWEPPYRLAFDVEEQPPALVEISPYRNLKPPHLDGYFSSIRGEFYLVDQGNGITRLEGTTWYELHIYPHAYWRPIVEQLLHRIHRRVLEQVATSAETTAVLSVRHAASDVPHHRSSLRSRR